MPVFCWNFCVTHKRRIGCFFTFSIFISGYNFVAEIQCSNGFHPADDRFMINYLWHATRKAF